MHQIGGNAEYFGQWSLPTREECCTHTFGRIIVVYICSFFTCISIIGIIFGGKNPIEYYCILSYSIPQTFWRRWLGPRWFLSAFTTFVTSNGEFHSMIEVFNKQCNFSIWMEITLYMITDPNVLAELFTSSLRLVRESSGFMFWYFLGWRAFLFEE